VREEYFIRALLLLYVINVFPLCSFIVVGVVAYILLLFPGRCKELKKDVTAHIAIKFNSAFYWIE
jgi:hypothetical protein